jgi:hypothetical protein
LYDVSRRAVPDVNPSQKGRSDIKSDLFYGEDNKDYSWRVEWGGVVEVNRFLVRKDCLRRQLFSVD